MFNVQVTTHVEAPADRVLRYLADFRNAPLWQRSLVDVQVQGPFPAARCLVEFRRCLRWQVRAEGELVSWAPALGFTLRRRAGPVSMESTYTARANSDGTEITVRLQGRISGLLRPLEPVLGWLLRRDFQGDLQRLSACLLQPELIG